jgi:hypothetical protein
VRIHEPETRGNAGKINYCTMSPDPSLSGADAEALESYRGGTPCVLSRSIPRGRYSSCNPPLFCMGSNPPPTHPWLTTRQATPGARRLHSPRHAWCRGDVKLGHAAGARLPTCGGEGGGEGGRGSAVCVVACSDQLSGSLASSLHLHPTGASATGGSNHQKGPTRCQRSATLHIRPPSAPLYGPQCPAGDV